MRAIVNLVKTAVKKVRKAFNNDKKVITDENKKNDFKDKDHFEPSNSTSEKKVKPVIKISKFHKGLMELGYTLQEAKKHGKIVHICKNTKKHRIYKKNVTKIFNLRNEVRKKEADSI